MFDRNLYIGQVGRVFTNGPGDRGPIISHTKDSKNGTWYLIA